jgi:Ran-binding protein 9/10
MANATDPPGSRQNGHREPPEMYGLSHRKILRQVSFETQCDCSLNPILSLR